MAASAGSADRSAPPAPSRASARPGSQRNSVHRERHGADRPRTGRPHAAGHAAHPSVSAPRAASASAVDGSAWATVRETVDGSSSSGNTMPDSSSSTTKMALAAASAHQRPRAARRATSARPVNASHRQHHRRDQGHGLDVGPPAEGQAAAASTATCTAITTSTASALAATSRGRPSGVVPSRLSTPYERSKPGGDGQVGERGGEHRQRERAGGQEVDGVAVDGQHVDQREEDEHRHRDAEREQQRLAVARASAPARAAAERQSPLMVPVPRPRSARRRLAADVVSRRKHVLQALAAGAEVGERQVVLGQPGGDGGDGRRGRCRRHLVLARGGLGHRRRRRGACGRAPRCRCRAAAANRTLVAGAPRRG